MDKTDPTLNIPFNYIAPPRNLLLRGITSAASVLIVSTFANPIPAAVAAISKLVISTISNLVTDIVISSKKTSLKTKKIFSKINTVIRTISFWLGTISIYIITAAILGLSFSTTCLSLLAFLGIGIASALILVALRWLLIIITVLLQFLTAKNCPALSTLIALPAYLATSTSSGDRFKDYLKTEKKKEKLNLF